MTRASIAGVIVAFFAAFGTPAGLQAQDSQLSPAETEMAPTSPVKTAAPPQDDPAALPVLVMLIGGGARFRNISLDVGEGTGGTQNRSFKTGAYFDFAWHLLVRPLGRRSEKPALQALVLQLDGGSGIGLEAQPAGMGQLLQTNTWRLLGQFGYLYPIDRVQVGGLVGVGGDNFTIDPNLVLPSSRIVYVRLGPAMIARIFRNYLGFRADFGLRFPFALGEFEAAFGADSRAFGLDGTAAFDGSLKVGFAYAVRFIWEYYLYRFDGPTDPTVAASSSGGGSGSDHALTIQLLLGWSL